MTKAMGDEKRVIDLDEWKSARTDHLVRATAADGFVRAFAVRTRDLVEEARQIHQTSPVATAALGRLLTAGVMMGLMMKAKEDLLTLIVKGDGPLGGITVTADALGHVKGFPYQPEVLIHANARGKLDVGGAVGRGTLTVVKDLGLREPYSSTVDLQSGEIGDDIAYYFMTSEQTPSSVGLGVLMNRENTVRQAGGFVLQLMPGATEEIAQRLEQRLQGVSSVTALLDAGYSPEEILLQFLGPMDPVILDRVPVSFRCDCTRDRVSRALLSLGRAELQAMAEEGEPIELGCHFCGKKYVFVKEEIEKMLQGKELP